MSKILPFLITTLIGFAAGICAGLWFKCNPRIDPPPAAVLGELSDAPLGSSTPAPTAISAVTVDPRREEALRQIKTEMDDFKKHIVRIKIDFRTKLEAVLTPQQLDCLKRTRERPSPQPGAALSKPPAPPAPPAPTRTSSRIYEGFDSTITIIMVPYSLERFDDELQFTPSQREKVHQLLLERREQFLELVDKTPPPSFKLLKLAPPETQQPAQTQPTGSK